MDSSAGETHASKNVAPLESATHSSSGSNGKSGINSGSAADDFALGSLMRPNSSPRRSNFVGRSDQPASPPVFCSRRRAAASGQAIRGLDLGQLLIEVDRLPLGTWSKRRRFRLPQPSRQVCSSGRISWPVAALMHRAGPRPSSATSPGQRYAASSSSTAQPRTCFLASRIRTLRPIAEPAAANRPSALRATVLRSSTHSTPPRWSSAIDQAAAASLPGTLLVSKVGQASSPAAVSIPQNVPP